MTRKIDEVFRKVLNDRNIFDTPWDREASKPIPKLFEEYEWKELKEIFKEGREDDFNKRIEDRLQKIEEKEKKADERRKQKIDKLKRRAQWLKSAFKNKRNLLENLFDNLEWYGLVECKLPAMNDCGIVIERYDISLVQQYFSDKVKKVPPHEKKALGRVLEYVMELYNAGVSSEEIAYFVRKIKSLALYWEVIE